MKTRTKYFALDGGLDMVTNPLSLPPGVLLDCVNFVQDITQGYTSFQGYERVDGQTKPSDDNYWKLDFTAGATKPSIGDTITGATSGQTGKVIADTVVSSGAFADNDAAGYFILGEAGAFTDSENLEVGGNVYAVADGTGTEEGVADATANFSYDHKAADNQRNNITSVPGSGDVLGVAIFNGTRYAFRNNAGQCLMYKESSSGWTQVAFGKTLYFTSGGTYEPSVGDTITGATSGATADIERIIVRSGAWADGDAAGYFILSNQTGTFQSENLDIGANADIGTISGDSSDITLSSGGSFEFVIHNFYGVEDYEELYFVDGVNKAHAFDGSILTPIDTGMTYAGYTDAPTHIGIKGSRLWLSFTGGSLQYSSLGQPVVFNAVTGAGEIGTGENITGLAALPGDALAALCRNQTYTYVGTIGTDFTSNRHAAQSGALDKTVQLVAGTLIYLDDRGLTSLAATDKYGNFVTNSLSLAVQPYIASRKENIICSGVNRSRSQYFLFFDDKTALCFTFGPEGIRGATVLYFAHQVTCVFSGEDSNGSEVMLIGCEDGYVREMYSGYDFDGQTVETYIRLPYYHYDSPRNNKRFISAVIENTTDEAQPVNVQFMVDFNYGSVHVPLGVSHLHSDTVSSAGAMWSSGVHWGSFYWDQPIVDDISAYLKGVGYNMSILIARPTDVEWEPPITLHGCIIEYTLMGKT